MRHTTIARYAESIDDPHGLFRTLGEPVCERDIYGEPKMIAGGNSVVFKVRIDGAAYALKCYFEPKERSRAVCDRLSAMRPQLMYDTRYLPGELFVYADSGAGIHRDVSLTEWAEGRTLENEIRKALHDDNRKRLSGLAAAFDAMVLSLLSQEWAHGDLKPENIMVAPDGQMRLIDYDAMYFPSFVGCAPCECGTPLYQHPRRDMSFYDRHIDDYPAAFIAATLHLLAAEPQLYGRFGNADQYIFSPSGIFGGRSEGYAAALDIASSAGDGALYTLLLMLAYPTPRLDGLAEVIKALADGLKYSSGNEEHSGTACSAPGKPSASVPAGTGHSSLARQTDRKACQSSSHTAGAAAGLTPFASVGRWGYADKEGRTAIPALFDTALEFSEGLAAVAVGGRNHFIAPDGLCALNCAQYEAVKSFSEGYAAVRRGGLWGYIDRSGLEIIAPQYKRCYSVRNGAARAVTESGDEEYLSFADIR